MLAFRQQTGNYRHSKTPLLGGRQWPLCLVEERTCSQKKPRIDWVLNSGELTVRLRRCPRSTGGPPVKSTVCFLCDARIYRFGDFAQRALHVIQPRKLQRPELYRSEHTTGEPPMPRSQHDGNGTVNRILPQSYRRAMANSDLATQVLYLRMVR